MFPYHTLIGFLRGVPSGFPTKNVSAVTHASRCVTFPAIHTPCVCVYASVRAACVYFYIHVSPTLVFMSELHQIHKHNHHQQQQQHCRKLRNIILCFILCRFQATMVADIEGGTQTEGV